MGNTTAKIAGYSDEELEELSPEELEGLEELDAEMKAESGDADAADADADEDGEKDRDDDQDDATNKADDSENHGKSTDNDAASKDDEDAAKKDDDTSENGDDKETKDGDGDISANNSPKPTYVAPDDLESKIKEIGDKKDEISEKFDDGELTAAEYRQQMKELEKDERALWSQQVRAEVSDDIVKTQWGTTVNEFLAENSQYKPNTPLYDALDAEVRRLQDAQPDNMYDPAILTKAHLKVVEQIEAMTGNKSKSENEEKPGKKTATDKKGLADIPPTLRDVPASDTDDAGDGGEFAELDRLANTNFEEYERKLAALSPADQDRFLQS